MDALLLRDSPEKLDLDLNNIYQNLQGIDESSIAELLAFKRNLEQDLLSYMVRICSLHVVVSFRSSRCCRSQNSLVGLFYLYTDH